MLNKVILIAILLLVGAQAQHFDMSIDDEFAMLMDTIDEDSFELQDTKGDVISFAKGFLEGIGSGKAFEDIKLCLRDSKEIANKIVTGLQLIRTKNPEKVKRGIQMLGEAVKVIPVAAAECKTAHADIQKLLKLVQMFTDPKSFIYHVGKSLLINRVEVIAEVRNILEALKRKDFHQVGFWTGRAMETVFIGGKNKLRQEMVDFINSENPGWEAEIPEQFENETLDEMAASLIPIDMMENMNFEDAEVMDYEGINEDIPAAFDSRTQWPGCVHGIMGQGKCGSCWAFAASEALSDRFCIATQKKIDVVLSPQFMVSCSKFPNNGCYGGNPFLSWKFLESKGVVTDQCLPYQSGEGKNPIKCRNIKTCADNKPLAKYYAKKKSTVILPNPKSIQMSILKDGPVEAGFMVYEDFKAYKGGIYKHVSGSILGGHAVKIVGWGEENGESYWIVANSWTEKWGENGFFRIAFGQCGIDKQCVVGLPDLERTQHSTNDFFLF